MHHSLVTLQKIATSFLGIVDANIVVNIVVKQ